MRLDELWVLNEPKDSLNLSATAASTVTSRSAADRGCFYFETCQRRVWVGQGGASPIGSREGEDAYLELLLIASGLESKIVGETDVFGQLKDSWRDSSAVSTSIAAGLRPVFQKLFEDVKEIRARHLEGLGGSSYGSLARRLLEPRPEDRVLIAGAGRIAHAVAPFFTESTVVIVNRTPRAAAELAAALKSRGARRVEVAVGEAAALGAWRESTHAIVCQPVLPDAKLDLARVAAWRSGGARGLVLHLGCLSPSESGPWAALSELRALDALFAMRSRQDGARGVAEQAARRACRERACLRALGGSLSLAHGWEDLAAFI